MGPDLYRLPSIFCSVRQEDSSWGFEQMVSNPTQVLKAPLGMCVRMNWVKGKKCTRMKAVYDQMASHRVFSDWPCFCQQL